MIEAPRLQHLLGCTTAAVLPSQATSAPGEENPSQMLSHYCKHVHHRSSCWPDRRTQGRRTPSKQCHDHAKPHRNLQGPSQRTSAATYDILCTQHQAFLKFEKLRMQKLPAGPGMHIIRDHRPKIYHRTVRHVLTSTSHRETGCKGDIVITNRLGRRHLSIGLDASLKAEKLPAKIAFLHIAVIAPGFGTLATVVVQANGKGTVPGRVSPNQLEPVPKPQFCESLQVPELATSSHQDLQSLTPQSVRLAVGSGFAWISDWSMCVAAGRDVRP